MSNSVSVASGNQVLTDAQRRHFLQYGYVVVSDCFSRQAAQLMIDDAYAQLGYDPNDASTWEQELAIFRPSQPTPIREFSPRLWAAIGEVIGGEERIADPDVGMGVFVINFHRGSDQPWIPPSPAVNGWHVDGNSFLHFLDSPEQGLLVVPLLSDVAHKGGGTVLAADSVPIIARHLRDHPEGLAPKELEHVWQLLQQCHDFREFTGSVGDVAIVHPFLLHSSSQNHSGVARFITNINIRLREPMNFHRDNAKGGNANEYSLVEQAILQGLGVEHLDFQIAAPRKEGKQLQG